MSNTIKPFRYTFSDVTVRMKDDGRVSIGGYSRPKLDPETGKMVGLDSQHAALAVAAALLQHKADTAALKAKEANTRRIKASAARRKLSAKNPALFEAVAKFYMAEIRKYGLTADGHLRRDTFREGRLNRALQAAGIMDEPSGELIKQATTAAKERMKTDK
jgi:hypothetical protein